MQFLVVGLMVILTTGVFAQFGPQPQRLGGNVSVNIGFGQQRRPTPPPPPRPVMHQGHHCDHPSHYRGHGKGHQQHRHPAHHAPQCRPHHGGHGHR